MASLSTTSDLSVDQDRHGQNKAAKPPHDPKAASGMNKDGIITEAERRKADGKGHFFGYEADVTPDAKRGLVTSMV